MGTMYARKARRASALGLMPPGRPYPALQPAGGAAGPTTESGQEAEGTATAAAGSEWPGEVTRQADEEAVEGPVTGAALEVEAMEVPATGSQWVGDLSQVADGALEGDAAGDLGQLMWAEDGIRRDIRASGREDAAHQPTPATADTDTVPHGSAASPHFTGALASRAGCGNGDSLNNPNASSPSAEQSSLDAAFSLRLVQRLRKPPGVSRATSAPETPAAVGAAAVGAAAADAAAVGATAVDAASAPETPAALAAAAVGAAAAGAHGISAAWPRMELNVGQGALDRQVFAAGTGSEARPVSIASVDISVGSRVRTSLDVRLASVAASDGSAAAGQGADGAAGTTPAAGAVGAVGMPGASAFVGAHQGAIFEDRAASVAAASTRSMPLPAPVPLAIPASVFAAMAATPLSPDNRMQPSAQPGGSQLSNGGGSGWSGRLPSPCPSPTPLRSAAPSQDGGGGGGGGAMHPAAWAMAQAPGSGGRSSPSGWPQHAFSTGHAQASTAHTSVHPIVHTLAHTLALPTRLSSGALCGLGSASSPASPSPGRRGSPSSLPHPSSARYPTAGGSPFMYSPTGLPTRQPSSPGYMSQRQSGGGYGHSAASPTAATLAWYNLHGDGGGGGGTRAADGQVQARRMSLGGPPQHLALGRSATGLRGLPHAQAAAAAATVAAAATAAAASTGASGEPRDTRSGQLLRKPGRLG